METYLLLCFIIDIPEKEIWAASKKKSFGEERPMIRKGSHIEVVGAHD